MIEKTIPFTFIRTYEEVVEEVTVASRELLLAP
jgi:hypothetical protein